MPIDVTKAVRFTELLHPSIQLAAKRLEERMAKIEFAFEIEDGPHEGMQAHGHFAIFETYRTPQRQNTLDQQVTKAGAWQSAHQYGLALDFAVFAQAEDPMVLQSWWWPEKAPWHQLHEEAHAETILTAPITWDPGHIEWIHFPALMRWMKEHRPGVTGAPSQ